MPTHLVFISLFLGIVSGKQQVELHADASVKSIRILLAAEEIARLTRPPWQGEIDLGSELVPRELQAIAYDESGNEIGRASQTINLPRPAAEVEIVLERSGGFPSVAQLRWRNLEYADPKSATMTFDGAPIKVDSKFRARLPRTDWQRPHVIDAQMKFADGMIARREAVLEGAVFSDVAQAELTPVLLTETSRPRVSLDGCLSLDGAPVRTAAVEKESANVILVQDPEPRDAIRALDPARAATNRYTRRGLQSWVRLDDDTTQQILWPVAEQFRNRSSHESSLLFAHTDEFPASDGLLQLLTLDEHSTRNKPRRYADAVAVAGIRAIADGRRRAVVLVLSDHADASKSDPHAVRRYLQSIGVPLFVWSLNGPRPDLADTWGPVDDISSIDYLRAAVSRLRATLAVQHVAWVHVDPLNALRVKADERCGVTTMVSR